MEKSCSLLVYFDKASPSLANEIKEALEGSDNERKQNAMKKAIMMLLNNEQIPHLYHHHRAIVLPSRGPCCREAPPPLPRDHREDRRGWQDPPRNDPHLPEPAQQPSTSQ